MGWKWWHSRNNRMMVVALVFFGFVSPERAASEPRSGEEIYHDYCSVCHGDKGDGRSRAQHSMAPPPRDFTHPSAAMELTRDRMVMSVKEGRPGTGMPPWKGQLLDAEVESVVDYIQVRMMLPIASEDAKRGRSLYASNCSVCHGDDGRGARWTQLNMNPSPRNFTLPKAREELSRDHMVHTAMFGRPNTAMPGFGSQLSKEDISAIVDYIRISFFVPASAVPTEGSIVQVAANASGQEEASGIDMSLPLPGGLVGDLSRGGGLYMANCSVCHGALGDGRGPRAYFILPKPRDFNHPGSKNTYNRPALYQAISRGKLGAEMPAWDTVLSDQFIADVAEYVFQSFILADPTGAAGS